MALLFVAGMAGSTSSSHAEAGECTTVCYVSTTGNDSTGTGHADAPFETIQRAINTVIVGGTVHVAAGSYGGRHTAITSVTLLGAKAGVPGFDPSRDGTGETVVTGSIEATGLGAVTVDGFSFHTAFVDPAPGSNLTVRNSRFQGDSGATAIAGRPRNFTFTRNFTEGDRPIISLNEPPSPGVVLISDNRFVDNLHGVIHVQDRDGVRIADNAFETVGGPFIGGSVYLLRCDTCVVEGNEFTDLRGTAAIGVTLGKDARIAGNEISGSTIASAERGIRITAHENGVVTGNIISDVDVGIELDSAAHIERNEITQVKTAIAILPGAGGTTIHRNTLLATVLGVSNGTYPVVPADATCNWWGHASGPSGAATGKGSGVSAGVISEPLLLTDDLDGDCQDRVDICRTDCYVDAVLGHDDNGGFSAAPFATIQKALDTVKPGGTVHVSAGQYQRARITKNVTLLGAQAAIPGPSKDRDDRSSESVIMGGPAGLEIDMGRLEVVIDGFRFEPTGAGQVGISTGYFAANTGANVQLKNNIFTGNFSSAVASSHSAPSAPASSFSIKDNLFDGNDYAISVRGKADASLHIFGNTFRGPVSSTVSLIGWTGAIVEQNTFLDVARVRLNDCLNCVFAENSMRFDRSAPSIVIHISGAATRNTVVSNNSITSDVPGITAIATDAHEVSVTGNTITGWFSAAVRVYAAANAATVTNNTIEFGHGTAVYLDSAAGPAANFIIEGNDIEGRGAGTGISLMRPATVRKNTLTKLSTGIGVDTPAAAASTINFNSIAGNSLRGLRKVVGVEGLDATCNWWGAADGPVRGPGLGSGDESPWNDPTIFVTPFLTTADINGPCDRVAPQVVITTPGEGATYLRLDEVIVDFTCADNVGLLKCEGTLAHGDELDTRITGAKTFTVTAVDHAGNVTTKSVSYAVVNAPPPAITLTSPVDGAVHLAGSTLVADFECVATTNPVAVCMGIITPAGAFDAFLLASPPGDWTFLDAGDAIDTSIVGTFELTVLAADMLGNLALESATYTVAPPPQPHISSVTPGNAFPGDNVTIHGWNFSGTTSVTFGGIEAAFVVIDDTRIDATVPQGVPDGPALIGIVTGTGSRAEGHQFVAGPPPTPGVPPAPTVATFELNFRWTLLTWVGIDAVGVEEALRGAEGGDSNAWAFVTAIYGYDGSTGEWRGFFPAGVDVPGANDLATLQYESAYWVAVDREAGAEWTVPLGP